MSDTLFPMESNLTELAAAANESHLRCEEAARTTLEHAMRAGEALTAAKELVPHGGWRDWLRENVRFSQRTAQLYMNVSREVPRLTGAKAQRVAHLGLSEVSRMLSAGPVASIPQPEPGQMTVSATNFGHMEILPCLEHPEGFHLLYFDQICLWGMGKLLTWEGVEQMAPTIIRAFGAESPRWHVSPAGESILQPLWNELPESKRTSMEKMPEFLRRWKELRAEQAG